jgi:Ca-activated chloride channel family protein
MKEIEEAYDKVGAEIRGQYSLGYVSSQSAQDGRWRKVEIKVRRPDLKGVKVQSRRGYFAPFDEKDARKKDD